MTKIVGYLRFFGLMIPTIIVLAAAVVSMADLGIPAEPVAMHLVVADPYAEVWEDQP